MQIDWKLLELYKLQRFLLNPLLECRGFSRNQNAGKLVKRCTENIKIVCTYVTAEDAGSSFPANHGKLFPRAFYARHGTERTSQSSQHQHSTQRCEFPVFRLVDSLIYSIHQTKNLYISPMCSAMQK